MPDPCGKCAMMITCLAREMAVVLTVCATCRVPIGVPIDESWDPILGTQGHFAIGYRRPPLCRRIAKFRKDKKAPRGICGRCLESLEKNRDLKTRTGAP